jgi:hypothetical protein
MIGVSIASPMTLVVPGYSAIWSFIFPHSPLSPGLYYIITPRRFYGGCREPAVPGAPSPGRWRTNATPYHSAGSTHRRGLVERRQRVATRDRLRLSASRCGSRTAGTQRPEGYRRILALARSWRTLNDHQGAPVDGAVPHPVTIQHHPWV